MLAVSPVRLALGEVVAGSAVAVKLVVEVVPAASVGSVPQTKFAAVIARPLVASVPLMVAAVDEILEAGVVVVAGPDVNPGATVEVSVP